MADLTVPDETDGAAWRAMDGPHLLQLMEQVLGPHRDGRPSPADVAEALRTQEVDRLTTHLFDDAVDGLHTRPTTESEREDRALAIYRAWLAWHLDHDLIPKDLR